MLTYRISSPEHQKGFIEIDFQVNNLPAETLEIYLPAWRPGRYELQQYAKNIQSIRVFNEKNGLVPVEKISRNAWKIHLKESKSLTVRYSYFVRQMDAGGCWVDEKMWYLNFVNCLFFIKNRQYEPCQVQLQLPENYRIACGLKPENSCIKASDYFELIDSPLVASSTLHIKTYQVGETTFNICLQSEYEPDWDIWVRDFRQFSVCHQAIFGEFPFSEYYFLIHILPYKMYHGVEHRNSTVISIGINPEDENRNIVSFDSIYKTDLLGIASHELFHTWNACRIRPKELLPYDLTQETYFKTGYIIEGITTFYGDWMLWRSGVWSKDEFFTEISKIFNKHFNTADFSAQSLLESSFDLWVDGYKEGIPAKKVSIYHKGCIVAMLLDLEIRKLTQNQKSLDDVMRKMWQNYGNQLIGYTHTDFIKICESIVNQSLADFFRMCVESNEPLLEKLTLAVSEVGWELSSEDFIGFEGGKTVKLSEKPTQTYPYKDFNLV